MKPMFRGASLLLALAVGCLSACEGSPFREVDLDTQAPTPPEAGPSTTATPFRVSVASMESPRWTYAEYAHLFQEIGRRMGMPVEFVQRRSYADVNALLASGGVDAALLCTGGYLGLEHSNPGSAEPLVIPIVHGKDTYQSLLIVPATSQAQSLADLRGKRFAFTDPLSLSGFTWIVHDLGRLGTEPNAFFGKTLFTSSHDRSIVAVSRGVVDGAAVHELIFAHMVARDPSLVAKTRVIARSPAFGMTPVVVSTRVPAAARAKLRDVMIALANDPAGAALLQAVDIDRFVTPPPGIFDSAIATVGP